MFSHEPLSEDTKELLDKVSMSIVDGGKYVCSSSPITSLFKLSLFFVLIITDVG